MKKLNDFEMLEILFYGALRGGLALFFATYMVKILSSIGILLPSNGLMRYIPLIIIVLIIFSVGYYFRNKPLKDYGFKKHDWKLTFSFFTLMFPISLIARLIDPEFDYIYANMTNLTSLQPLLSFIIIMPLVIVYEELIERSLLQSRFKGFSRRLICIIIP